MRRRACQPSCTSTSDNASSSTAMTSCRAATAPPVPASRALKKEYYGVEVGAKIKLTSWLDLKTLGAMSEAYKDEQIYHCLVDQLK